jgi:hypothetical protein
MQLFISQIAAGRTDMEDLIKRDGLQTRQEIQQSEMRVKNSINAVHIEADMEAKGSRLLRSLKFESMNARRTGITIANEATYVSFFETLEFDEVPTSGSAAAAWANFVGWLQSDEQAFWIQGKPGAGKSTLVKFLLQHENTSKALNKWSHNPLIVSHFFWKPGIILQRSLRGLLCSLNHQLLSGEQSVIDQILSEFEFTKDKDSVGDWEISQLMEIFKFISTNCNRPIFFLIDGVDEADDAEGILKFLTFSTTLCNTKWCIASRGEEIFQRIFSKHKGFKLNEYTKEDMLNFAQKEIQDTLVYIQGYETIYTEQFLRDLQHTLVYKAEGVYLWLVLALESIKRGFRNSDRQDTMLSRLRSMPTELEKLYMDMWDRLGEDKGIYQKEAAHYFNLLISHQALVDEYNNIYEREGTPDWFLTPFQIMLAQNDELQRSLLNKSYELQLLDLEKRCSDMTKSISVKTAGLLVIQHNTSVYPRDLQVRAEYSQLENYATKIISFIHRTLFDFLRDTEFGRSILLQAPVDLVYVQHATMMLCQLRIMEMTSAKFLIKDNLLWRGNILHCFHWLLNQAQKIDDLSNERVFNILLPAYEALFEASIIPWDPRPDRYPRPCFDVLLLSDTAFQPFINERLKKKGGSYATCVLREYMSIPFLNFYSQYKLGAGINIREFSHGIGADINSAGVCFYEPPVDVGQFAGCFTYESTLSAFVKRLYARNLYDRRESLTEQMRDLVAFLKSSPDLDTHTSRLIWSDYALKKIGDGNLIFLLSTLSVGKNESIYDLGYSHKSFAALITEANLKYLIEHLLESLLLYDTATNALISRALQLVKEDASEPYIKARFIIRMQNERYPQTHQATCYKFMDEYVDIFSEFNGSKLMKSEIYPTFTISEERVDEYLKFCKEVDVSALSILLDQRLGVCFREARK